MRIRSFLQEIRFLSLSYWWMWLLCSHWNHLFLSSSFMCIYAMNWMNFFFCFSLVLFDGLIIALLYLFVNIFLWFYGIIFIYLFYYVFIFYNLFVFFIIFCKFVVLCRVGGVAKRTAEKGGGVRVGLRRSSASKAAWILLEPLKKSQNSRLPPLKQLGFFQQRSLPAA